MRPAASHNRGASVLMAVFLAGCGAPSASVLSTSPSTPLPLETATTAPPTPSAPSETVVPPPTAAPTAPPASDAGWRAAPDQDSVRGGQFTDVAWTGSRFIAIAGDGILDSDDGLAWHRQPVAAGTVMLGLASGPEGSVAFGTAGGATLTWRSADGLAWTRSATPLPMPALGDDSITVHDIVPMATGWLAVGTREAPCFLECDLIRAHVWTSADGLTWTRVARQPALEGGGMNAVVKVGSGFVAAGAIGRQAAVWTSPDGLAWSSVADTQPFREHGIKGSGRQSAATGVATHGSSVVVVGQAYEQDLCPDQYDTQSCGGARAWWSVDTLSWGQATMERARDGQVFGAASTPRGFLAYGPSGTPSCVGGIWFSATGAAWTCEKSKARAYELFGPYAGAASDTLEVVVGLTNDGWDEEGDEGLPGSVWVHALP